MQKILSISSIEGIPFIIRFKTIKELAGVTELKSKVLKVFHL